MVNNKLLFLVFRPMKVTRVNILAHVFNTLYLILLTGKGFFQVKNYTLSVLSHTHSLP